MVNGSDLPKRAVRLTRREVEVLSLIAEGYSSQEAADKLFVSKRTVDFHLANIYAKLQVSNRVQAFQAATRMGLLKAPWAESSTDRQRAA